MRMRMGKHRLRWDEETKTRLSACTQNATPRLRKLPPTLYLCFLQLLPINHSPSLFLQHKPDSDESISGNFCNLFLLNCSPLSLTKFHQLPDEDDDVSPNNALSLDPTINKVHTLTYSSIRFLLYQSIMTPITLHHTCNCNHQFFTYIFM